MSADYCSCSRTWICLWLATSRKETAREQEYATQQARDELQQLKGKIQLIQRLSVTEEFYSISMQDNLKKQLQDGIKEVEKSDNQYLQDVSIPISSEINILEDCNEASSYINYWLEEIG